MRLKHYYDLFVLCLLTLSCLLYIQNSFQTQYHILQEGILKEDFEPLKKDLEALIEKHVFYKKQLIEGYLVKKGYLALVTYRSDHRGSIDLTLTFPQSSFVINDSLCFSAQYGFTPAPCLFAQEKKARLTAPSSLVEAWQETPETLMSIEQTLEGPYDLMFSSFSYVQYDDPVHTSCRFSLDESWLEKLGQYLRQNA